MSINCINLFKWIAKKCAKWFCFASFQTFFRKCGGKGVELEPRFARRGKGWDKTWGKVKSHECIALFIYMSLWVCVCVFVYVCMNERNSMLVCVWMCVQVMFLCVKHMTIIFTYCHGSPSFPMSYTKIKYIYLHVKKVPSA